MGFMKRFQNKFNITVQESHQCSNQYSRSVILDFFRNELAKLPFVPRKYQLQMTLGILQNERHLGILSTGGGKSLVAFLVINFLKQHNQQTILIVPTINLVDQMYSDFLSYNAEPEFMNNIQRLGGNYTDKNLNKSVVITTWQSLKNVKKEIIQNYDCLYVDEAHKAKADVLNEILKLDVRKKVGQTGSMPIVQIDYMKLEEIFGYPTVYANAKDLIKLGLLTKTTIIAVYLNYPRKDTKSNMKYQEENKFIREYKPRIEYTKNLLITVQKVGISVATFGTIKFGETLYKNITGIDVKRIRNKFIAQKKLGVFFISGGTKPEIREEIRLYLNSAESNNEILIAQTSTMDTGINIPKLKNFIFAETPGKSFTKILQSIGRVMRKSKENGNNVYVWDLVDCFDYKKENYALVHFWDRMNFYVQEGHPVIENEVGLKLV